MSAGPILNKVMAIALNTSALSEDEALHLFKKQKRKQVYQLPILFVLERKLGQFIALL